MEELMNNPISPRTGINLTLDLLVVGDSSDILMIEMCVNASVENGEHKVNELTEDELLEYLKTAQDAITKSASIYEEKFREL